MSALSLATLVPTLASPLGDQLAALNATLNATSAVLALAGLAAIKQARQRKRHERLMLSAVVVSSVFLISYLTRIAISGTHRYPGSGAWKALYLTILTTHVLLAIAVPPLVLGAIWLAYKDRIAAHRRLVRWAYPVWLYVSVTGVVVYVMLYRALPPG